MKTLTNCVAAFFFVLAGCRSDPAGPSIPPPAPTVLRGVYVLNEGNYSDATGARLSLYDVDSDTVFLDVIEAANGGTHLGNVGDDIKLHNGKAYIAMGGSDNLVVVSLDSHQILQSKLYPDASPKELLIDSLRSKIYITRLFDGSILVVDLTTLAVIDSVRVGAFPQGMALSGNSLFVCNSGYGSDRTVTVISVPADTVRSTLTLSDGPTGIATAPDGRLWIACTGSSSNSPPTTGKVFILNPSTLAVEDSVIFTENLWGSIAIGDDGYAYVLGITPASFYGGPVHRVSLSSRSVWLNFIHGTFYAHAIDVPTNEIYVADVREFNSNGEVSIFGSDGVLKRFFTAQRGPGAFAFKR